MQAALPAPGLRRSIRFAVAFLLACTAGACAAPAKSPKLTPKQKVERDERIGRGLASRFERELALVTDAAVESYLNGLLTQLLAPEAPAPGARVRVYRPEAGEPWAGYSLPVQRLYLPAPLLREIDFESELAALLAVELARLQAELVLSHLPPFAGPGSEPGPDPSKVPEFFGEKGLFEFDDKETFDALPVAVGILYRAGFDGRGLVAHLERYRAYPEASPYSPARLEKMIDLARRTIALSSPLRNPIVRSPAFQAIRPRLRRL